MVSIGLPVPSGVWVRGCIKHGWWMRSLPTHLRAQTPLCLRPPPRFHNGTLLDRRVHRSGAHLELRALRPEQAGTYHCKAWNDAGAVRSATARLSVLGEHSGAPKPDSLRGSDPSPVPFATHHP